MKLKIESSDLNLECNHMLTGKTNVYTTAFLFISCVSPAKLWIVNAFDVNVKRGSHLILGSFKRSVSHEKFWSCNWDFQQHVSPREWGWDFVLKFVLNWFEAKRKGYSVFIAFNRIVESGITLFWERIVSQVKASYGRWFWNKILKHMLLLTLTMIPDRKLWWYI